MMRITELATRRIHLLDKIAGERVALRAAAETVRDRCGVAERIASSLAGGVRKPWLLSGIAVVSGIVLARHPRLLRWASYAASAVSMYAGIRRFVGAKRK
jgi:hypothetical protein